MVQDWIHGIGDSEWNGTVGNVVGTIHGDVVDVADELDDGGHEDKHG